MKSTIAVLALAALVVPSLAQDEEKKEPRKRGGDPAKVFEKKDTDSSGSLSLEEFTEGAKDAERAGKAFERLDKDGNGELSLEEFKARSPKGKGKGGGKGKKKEDAGE